MSAALATMNDEGASRVPPHDLGAERAVLSSLLLDPKAFSEVQSEISNDDFYHPAHALLYRRMSSLHDEGKPVDLITLHALLDSNKELERIGGAVYLAELAQVAATAANVSHYLDIVRDKAVKRRLISVATEIVASGYNEDEAAGKLLDFAESRILEVSKDQSRTTFQNIYQEIVRDQGTFDFIDEILKRGGAISGLATGFKDFDQLTGGLQKGELAILAARPSMGKSALALNIARNAALKAGAKVAMFSLEMSLRDLILRILSSEANVDVMGLRNGFLSKQDYGSLKQASDKLYESPVWIDDSASLTILEIKAKARRLYAEQGGLDLVIVDYLQFVRGEQRNHQRKDLEIADISRGLKALAKELQLPVLALSQLNRGPEQRDPDKRRPMMGDLRESGAIEQDADLVAFIYRDVVYNKETEDPRKAEIIIEKQRNGPTGTVYLDFDSRFARFSDRSARGDEPHGAETRGGFTGPEGGPPGTRDFGYEGGAAHDGDEDF